MSKIAYDSAYVRQALAAVLLLSGLLVGCSSDGGMTSIDGHAGSDMGTQGGPTFQAVRSKALLGCGGFPSCHKQGPFAGMLDLTDANAYAALVNVRASIAPSKLRVKPGDPAGSFLMQKLTNQLATDGSEGNPMPRGEAMPWRELPPDVIATVQGWIAAGAPNN